MTKHILTILLLLPILAVAQNGTTLDEYRFLSKGYAYQKSMGLDARKEGYDLVELAPTTNDQAFIGMYKAGATKPQAILLILQRTTLTPTYVCIPNETAPKTVLHLYDLEEKRIMETPLALPYVTALKDLAFHLLGEKPSQRLASTDIGVTQKETTFTEKGVSEITPKENMAIPETYDLQVSNSKAGNTLSAINTAVAITIDEIITKRAVLKSPVIIGEYSAKGKVAIKFCIDAEGRVSSAKFTQSGSTTFNKALIEKAKASVKNASFSEGDYVDCGKAVFHFQ